MAARFFEISLKKDAKDIPGNRGWQTSNELAGEEGESICKHKLLEQA